MVRKKGGSLSRNSLCPPEFRRSRTGVGSSFIHAGAQGLRGDFAISSCQQASSECVLDEAVFAAVEV